MDKCWIWIKFQNVEFCTISTTIICTHTSNATATTFQVDGFWPKIWKLIHMLPLSKTQVGDMQIFHNSKHLDKHEMKSAIAARRNLRHWNRKMHGIFFNNSILTSHCNKVKDFCKCKKVFNYKQSMKQQLKGELMQWYIENNVFLLKLYREQRENLKQTVITSGCFLHPLP